MKFFTKGLFKAIIALIVLSLIIQSESYSQTGSFSKVIEQDGWSGNVEFNVPYGSGAKPLIIGLHPAQSPAWGIRNMLQASSDKYQAILVCPDGIDETLSESIIPLINYCKTNYNIDESKIILTGYSRGGSTTFEFGPQNYQLFKGLIGIAASGWNVSQSAVNSLGFAMICGTSDDAISYCRDFKDAIVEAGGQVLLIEKPGVEHKDPYFGSSDFSNDWNTCYDFVMNFIPKPSQIVLTSPQNGEEDVEIPVTLEWNTDPNAESYEVEISDKDGLVDRKTAKTTSVQISNLDPGTEYTWLVRGKNSGGEGIWSQEWIFTTKPVAPTLKVELLEPADQATNLPKDITFIWSVIEGAAEYKIQVLLENDSLFKENENILPDDETTVSKTIRNLSAKTNFKWKVLGLNSAGEGPWSDIRTFSTAAGKPTEVIVISEPVDQAKDVSTLPTLTWRTIPDADKYYLQLSETGSSDFLIEDSTIAALNDTVVEYKTTSELQGLKTYRWRVAGLNSTGRGPWTAYRTFTTWDPLNVNENSLILGNISISPNPVNDFINVCFDHSTESEFDFSIYNLCGQKVMVFSKNIISGNNNILKIETKDLKNGLYFIKINSENFELMKSFIVMK